MPRKSKQSRVRTPARNKRSSSRGKNTESQIDFFWKSRGVVVGLMVVVLFMSVAVVKEVVRKVETQYEIQQLENEVARLENRNTEIQDLIALFNTSSYQEKQARERLNAADPSEKVLILPHRIQEKDIVLPDSDRVEYISLTDHQTNPEKWYSYFNQKLQN